MVRHYKRKTERGAYGSEQLKAALEAIKSPDGMPLLRASKFFWVPTRTLRRHRDGMLVVPGAVRLGRHHPVLPPDVEQQIHDHIQSMETRLYGLSTLDVRRLAFDVAERSNLSHPFNRK